MGTLERSQAALKRKATLQRLTYRQEVTRAMMAEAEDYRQGMNRLATYWTGIRVSGLHYGRKEATRGGRFKAKALVAA